MSNNNNNNNDIRESKRATIFMNNIKLTADECQI